MNTLFPFAPEEQASEELSSLVKTEFVSIHLTGFTMSFRVNSGVYIDENYRLHYPDGASLMDGFPDELREVVDNHWEQFPPQHPMVIDFFGVLFFFLFLICFFGNALVIYVFLTSKDLRTPVSKMCFLISKIVL